MSLYLCITGKEHKLASCELALAIKNLSLKIVKEKDGVIVLKGDLPEQFIDRVANVVKIAEVIAHGTLEEIEYALDHLELYTRQEKKFIYFVTEHDADVGDFFCDYCKARFKEEQLKAMYKKEQNPSPKRLLGKNVLEFITFEGMVARVLFVADMKDMQKRDVQRPHANYDEAISLRLAKTMVNLADCKAHEIILDPYPGTGTILQEAYLLQKNSVGISSQKDLQANISWLKQTYPSSVRLQIIPAYTGRVDAIVTKPSLGPTLKRAPKLQDARMFARDYLRTLSVLLEKVVAKKMVLIVPTWHTAEQKPVTPSLQNLLEDKGFTQVDVFPLQTKKGARLTFHVLAAKKAL